MYRERYICQGHPGHHRAHGEEDGQLPDHHHAGARRRKGMIQFQIPG